MSYGSLMYTIFLIIIACLVTATIFYAINSFREKAAKKFASKFGFTPKDHKGYKDSGLKNYLFFDFCFGNFRHADIKNLMEITTSNISIDLFNFVVQSPDSTDGYFEYDIIRFSSPSLKLQRNEINLPKYNGPKLKVGNLVDNLFPYLNKKGYGFVAFRNEIIVFRPNETWSSSSLEKFYFDCLCLLLHVSSLDKDKQIHKDLAAKLSLQPGLAHLKDRFVEFNEISRNAG